MLEKDCKSDHYHCYYDLAAFRLRMDWNWATLSKCFQYFILDLTSYQLASINTLCHINTMNTLLRIKIIQ
jgi:hypothetical protein